MKIYLNEKDERFISRYAATFEDMSREEHAMLCEALRSALDWSYQADSTFCRRCLLMQRLEIERAEVRAHIDEERRAARYAELVIHI